MNPRPQRPTNTGKPSITPIVPTPAELLAKMPRRPMSPEQQAAALDKVQQQVTQRVKLGQQLFEAAEARLKQQQQVLHEIQQQQQKLREQVQEDVAKSLQTYDQWMGRIDESFTGAIRELNSRIDTLESRFDDTRGEMEQMINRAAALLEQTQELLVDALGDDDAPTQRPAITHDTLDKLVGGFGTPGQQDGAPTPAQVTRADDETEVYEVEVVDQEMIPEMPDDDLPREPGEDVFGEVLRRLRANEDDNNAAA